MACPECGTDLMKGARFCHTCGWDSKLAAAGRASSTAHERPAWKRRTTAVTLTLFAAMVLWLLLVPRRDAEASLIAGQAAPDFALQSLDGKGVRLSDLKGQPVVINFWATWCGPCRKEMPEFERVWQANKDKGLKVYGVNVGEPKIGVTDFVKQVKATFPILIDEKDVAQTAYKILPLPATFFVDRTGVIRAVYQYQMSAAQIDAEVQRLMAR